MLCDVLPFFLCLSVFFLVPFHFCCRFLYLADSVVVLASLGLYTEKDIAFLKSKVAMMNKLYLNSDIPPKLKVGDLEQRFAKQCVLHWIIK